MIESGKQVFTISGNLDDFKDGDIVEIESKEPKCGDYVLVADDDVVSINKYPAKGNIIGVVTQHICTRKKCL